MGVISGALDRALGYVTTMEARMIPVVLLCVIPPLVILDEVMAPRAWGTSWTISRRVLDPSQ